MVFPSHAGSEAVQLLRSSTTTAKPVVLSDLAARVRQPEWMDEAGLDPRLHRQALRGLARINVASGTVRAVWPPLEALARRLSPAPVSVLDVACGAGDVAMGLQRRARRAGLQFRVEGCDISPTALEHAARLASRRGSAVRFFQHDILAGDLPGHYDAVTCSLFLHHLDQDEAVGALRAMQRAARWLVVVSDLDRGRMGLALAWLGTRLLSRSPVMRVDGTRSVRAAFTPAEAEGLAREAGLAPFTVERRWPRRWRLVAGRS
jgi:2-polyprenyl-3-methyl-5-hydroxy-6-metoxy-1,4-benzoquinol methylase